MSGRQIRNLITAVIALGVCVGAFFGLRGWNAARKEKEKANDIYLFQTEELNSLSFTDTEGQKLTFTKTGEDWSYSDERFPLDTTKLNTLINSISALKAVRRIDKPEALSNYGLDAPSKVVEAADAQQSVTISLGNAAESNMYARKNDEKEVYVISNALSSALEVKLLDLAEIPSFPILSEATIEKITLSGAADPLVLQKKTVTSESTEACTEGEDCTDGSRTKSETVYSWTDGEGKEVASDDARLTGMLTALQQLQFSACADYDADAQEMSAYGLDEPVTLTVDYTEGSLTLAIGSKAEGTEDSVYATLNGSSSVYDLPQTSVDGILSQ